MTNRKVEANRNKNRNRIVEHRNRFRREVNKVEQTTELEVDRELYLTLKNMYDAGFTTGIEYLKEAPDLTKQDKIEDIMYYLSNTYQDVRFHMDDTLKLMLDILADNKKNE